MDFSKLNCMKPLLSRRSRTETDSVNTETTLTLRYVGKGQLTKPGLKDMCEFVTNSFETQTNKQKQREFEKSQLVISGQEMFLTPMSGGVKLPVVFKIRRVQFCGIYQGNPKIFFFTYQFGKTADIVECHILMCKTRKDAKKIAKRAQTLFKDITFSLHKQSPGNTKEHAEVANEKQSPPFKEKTRTDNKGQDLKQ